MAVVSVTIPDSLVARVNNAFATAYSYQATINGVANPETKAQFAKRQIIKHIKEVVKSTEARDAAEVARQAALTTAETDINIT